MLLWQASSNSRRYRARLHVILENDMHSSPQVADGPEIGGQNV